MHHAGTVHRDVLYVSFLCFYILLQHEKDNSQVLEEKLKQALAKMAEYRNQCEILKKEAKIAQKVMLTT